jgi:hypothetical protein
MEILAERRFNDGSHAICFSFEVSLNKETHYISSLYLSYIGLLLLYEERFDPQSIRPINPFPLHVAQGIDVSTSVRGVCTLLASLEAAVSLG